MKTLTYYTFRLLELLLIEICFYYTSTAIPTSNLSNGAHLVIGARARLLCSSIKFSSAEPIIVHDSAQVIIVSGDTDAISGFDSVSRFFILGNHASLERNVDQLASYVYPIGYASNNVAYRSFGLHMKSLGTTGPARVAVSLIPYISGAIHYEKYFPSSDTTCVAGTVITFNCLSADGWHCEGPSDYEYVADGYANSSCGSFLRRLIKTTTDTYAWQDSIEGVVGDFGGNLCEHSAWGAGGTHVPGGTYRNFSDFAIAASTSALPVTLMDIQANPISSSCIRVSWRTELEIDNDRFLITRSTDGVSFSDIGQVDGSGNSSSSVKYSFDDMTPVSNVGYYYQLKQFDYDGQIHYSHTVFAKITQNDLFETKRFNILGQEILESVPGLQIVQTISSWGSYSSKVLKPVP